jgi:superfamily II DNA or RNA helicase
MQQKFKGWDAVTTLLRQQSDEYESEASVRGDNLARLNAGQRASLRAIANRICNNGLVIADEVGMGKTRIAVEVAKCVVNSGGRVAILVPPGLGYQWQTELQEGGLSDVPLILRSLHGFLNGWTEGRTPWFNEPVVVVSHAFTNWRLGEATHPWRWAVVPEVYAAWRHETGSRLPRNYRENGVLLKGRIAKDVAESIVKAVPKVGGNLIRKRLDEFLEVPWPSPLDASNYSKNGSLRVWLERIIGVGLGSFDLVIIDEAHKNRRLEGGLSRLVNNLIVSTKSTRRISITATPVELDVSQWESTLERLGLKNETLADVKAASERYAFAVNRLRQTWQTSTESRDEYKSAAEQFQTVLSPYLLRRDKREDPDVLRFQEYSKLSLHAYRRQIEISVETKSLSLPWRKAICAAESLSVVIRQSDDSVAKRLRLTVGNGHGITALLDQINATDEDHGQEPDVPSEKKEVTEDLEPVERAEQKRQQRAQWWLDAIGSAFKSSEESLFEHPAILAAVNSIEEVTRSGEKVLVFGRFTRPMRALVNLLNAREMLRRVDSGASWPQAKVHQGDGNDESELPAVRAAHRQLASTVSLDSLDLTLNRAYERDRRQRQSFGERLIPMIEEGLSLTVSNKGVLGKLFEAFKRSNEIATTNESRSVTFVARAILDNLGVSPQEATAIDCANEFMQLIAAASDRESAETDPDIDDDQATELWETIELRLNDEFNRPQGGFARLMYGGTRPESRRMIQLAFNRHRSFPRVLVAQSLVGREGLNLHKACRTVILLHPEWNPGVVEQQIGRVDRVGSHWCKMLNAAIASKTSTSELPRIEIRPIIFRGTYDEWNWKVLKNRWDSLRSQLHGVVITPSDSDDEATRILIDELECNSPNFSPAKEGKV